jgi:hypothetical protein
MEKSTEPTEPVEPEQPDASAYYDPEIDGPYTPNGGDK